ncbi:hypothetical protein QOT17_004876 [Balamuthia mandrillaris]
MEKKVAGVCAVDQLPTEVLFLILSNLGNVGDLVAASLVCKEWCSVAHDQLMWKALYWRLSFLHGEEGAAAVLTRSAAMLMAAEESQDWRKKFRERVAGDKTWMNGRHEPVFFNPTEASAKKYNTTKVSSSFRGCAFSPVNEPLFSTACYNGMACLCNAAARSPTEKLVKQVQLIGRLHSTRWNLDGTKVMFGSHNNSLSVVDVERWEPLHQYANQFFGGSDRGALAISQEDPNLVAGGGNPGAEHALFDIRVKDKPIRTWKVHTHTIRDMCFVDGSWFGLSSGELLLSCGSGANSSGQAILCDLAGNVLASRCIMEVGESPHWLAGAYSVTVTPPYFGSGNKAKYDSKRCVTVGLNGKVLLLPCNQFTNSNYEKFVFLSHLPQRPVWKLRYNSNGTLLFAASDGGVVNMYHRKEDGSHIMVKKIIQHLNDIEDCDISIHDNYLITASQDDTIGIVAPVFH